MRGDQERIRDILEAIEQIERYATRDRACFESDELIQVWMVHHLRIIGEAARLLSDNTKQKFVQVPWKQIIGMRHYIVHEYFKIDAQAVWNSVVNDVPKLRKAIQNMGEGSRDTERDD